MSKLTKMLDFLEKEKGIVEILVEENFLRLFWHGWQDGLLF